MVKKNSSSKLGWGILSTAWIAEYLVQPLKLAGRSKLIAIASRTEATAHQFAVEHGVPKTYGSYESMLEDPDIDVVYIPLPNSLHCEWSLKAARAGKHVLCEKPLGIDAAEALEMAAACRQHGVQLMDGVMWVHHPRAAAMKKQLVAGAIGELRRVTSAFTFRFDEIPDYDIRLDPDTAGGSLGDLGWYLSLIHI